MVFSNKFLKKFTNIIPRAACKYKIESFKFAFIGVVNFALTLMIFTTMLKVFGVNYLLSLLAAWVVGMFFSYVLNFVWVFKPEKKIQFRARFFKFFLTSASSISMNMFVLNYIVERAKSDPFYVQMILIPFVVMFNFLAAKFWSLKGDEHS
ncbi:GtrA family protein [Burkholderiales bacterium]|nr:GtrA family protein [Burkholderiales bacterium]